MCVKNGQLWRGGRNKVNHGDGRARSTPRGSARGRWSARPCTRRVPAARSPACREPPGRPDSPDRSPRPAAEGRRCADRARPARPPPRWRSPAPRRPGPAGRRPRRPARPASGSARPRRGSRRRRASPRARSRAARSRRARSLESARAPAPPSPRASSPRPGCPRSASPLGRGRARSGRAGRRRPAGAGEGAVSRARAAWRAPSLSTPGPVAAGRLDCPGPRGYCSCTQMHRPHRAPAVTIPRKEVLMRRVLVLGLAVLFAVGLGLVPAASAQTREETLIYALQSDIDNWDPPNSVLREAIILGYHVFDHLAVRDLKTRKVIPNLAISWKTIDDTTWEVKLRQGVKFHDGTPFTSKDVRATFDRVLDPVKKMIARGNHAKIKTVEIVDDYTVRFKTDGPYPLFVERMTAQVMESEKVIREKGDEWMQEHPVGTGPYKLVKWARKQEHLLVRNDDYWGPKPYYKYVRIRIIPEQATQIAELISGGVDVIKAVPPDQMDVINKSGQARTATAQILRTAMLQLDQAGRGGPNPFTDRRVRQAANLAIDADAAIKHVLNLGTGSRRSSTQW